MTHMEITALEHSARATHSWMPEGYDGQTHVLPLLAALIPALFIVGAAAFFLFAVV